MYNYVIGRLTSVSSDKMEVLLDDFRVEEGKDRGVPENMCVSINVKDEGPTPVLIGQPGTFVSIPLVGLDLLCMVLSINMVDRPISITEAKENYEEDAYTTSETRRVLTVIPIGSMFLGGFFEPGSDVLPTVNSDVEAVPPNTIDKVFSSFAEGNFAIGQLSLLPSQEAKINLDSFLGRHNTILGQTGSGKSWAVASIIQNISKSFRKSSVVLFDLHDEYGAAFDDRIDRIDASTLELPYWLMNSEELLGLMVDRSESAAPNQIAKFKELLQKAKLEHTENSSLGIKKITIDTPVYFDFNSIIEEFRRLDVETVQGKTKQVKGPLNGQFSRLLMRIDSRLNDARYDLIFKPKKYVSSASMADLFRKLLGEEIGNQKNVVIINMSTIPFDVRSSVISLIMRCLFDFCYWHRRKKSQIYPLSLFCDEAHLYLNDKDSGTISSRLSAERIAKEGRKYGISLSVISQRPREVSSTILSQVGSFACLRLTNPDDQSYVRSLLSGSIKGVADTFSSLRKGECILIGDSVLMPTRIKLYKPSPAPDSNDCSFSKKWSKDHVDIDIDEILDAWRRQEA